MKKQKLRLVDLKTSSFVTLAREDEIKAGGTRQCVDSEFIMCDVFPTEAPQFCPTGICPPA